MQLAPVLDQISALQAELEPYETIKANLVATRARYRELLNQFLDTLTRRCNDMSEAQTAEMVLHLLEERVQIALDVSLMRKRQVLVSYVESLWDKYQITLSLLQKARSGIETTLTAFLAQLGVVGGT